MWVSAVKFLQLNEQTLGRRMKKQLRENLAVLKDLLEVKQFHYEPQNAGTMSA